MFGLPEASGHLKNHLIQSHRKPPLNPNQTTWNKRINRIFCSPYVLKKIPKYWFNSFLQSWMVPWIILDLGQNTEKMPRCISLNRNPARTPQLLPAFKQRSIQLPCPSFDFFLGGGLSHGLDTPHFLWGGNATFLFKSWPRCHSSIVKSHLSIVWKKRLELS